jgi:hypothetical protein
MEKEEGLNVSRLEQWMREMGSEINQVKFVHNQVKFVHEVKKQSGIYAS